MNGPNQSHPLDIDINLGSRTGFWRLGVVKTEISRLVLEPEGPINMAESCWETDCLDTLI